MMKWLAILIVTGQCYAGSTNWIAQRPSLVSDYGNFFFSEQLPIDIYTNCVLWLPFSAPTPSTQYSFAVARATNDVTISGAVWTNENSGAMWFDGIDDKLTTAQQFSLTNKLFTFNYWIKPSPKTGDQQLCLFSKSTAFSQNNVALELFIYYDLGFSQIIYWGGTKVDERPAYLPPTNAMSMLTFVFSNTVISVYTNGLFFVSYTNSFNIPALNTDCIIGNLGRSTGLEYRGTIPEFQFYDYPLSSNQIRSLYR